MSAVKLETRGVSKSFHRRDGAIEVLADVNLRIQEGEFVSIVGASGCGKTTLLRLIDGLIPPTAGEVLLDGRPLATPGPQLGFVFQQDCLLPWRAVLTNTVLGPELRHADRPAALSLARRMIRLVGLEQFEKYYPHELSGGMRQRVNLARALTVSPDVLLMDEPFAALDAQTREIMQAELLRIWRETRKTVLFVTHQVDEAVYLSDRVLVFTVRPGRLKEEVVVDLPRPRSLAIKRTPEFVRYTDRVWRLIEEEVRAGMGLEIEAAAARQPQRSA